MTHKEEGEITLLQATSCLFGLTVLHAYAKGEPVLHGLCLCVTVMSVLNHSVAHRGVRLLDSVCAHALFLYALVGLWVAGSGYLWLVVIVMQLWVAEHLVVDARNRELLHACLHLTAQLGPHGYLVGLERRAQPALV